MELFEFVVIEKEMIIEYSNDAVVSNEEIIEIIDSPNYIDNIIYKEGVMINRDKLLLEYIPFKLLGSLGFGYASSNSAEWFDGKVKHIRLTYIFQKGVDY